MNNFRIIEKEIHGTGHKSTSWLETNQHHNNAQYNQVFIILYLAAVTRIFSRGVDHLILRITPMFLLYFLKRRVYGQEEKLGNIFRYIEQSKLIKIVKKYDSLMIGFTLENVSIGCIKMHRANESGVLEELGFFFIWVAALIDRDVDHLGFEHGLTRLSAVFIILSVRLILFLTLDNYQCYSNDSNWDQKGRNHKSCCWQT